MKNSYGKFIALGLLVTLALTYSCKKLLKETPVGQLSGATLANKAGLDGLLIGAYSMLDGYGETSTEWESGIDNWAYGGIAADDAFKGSNTTDQPTAAPIENHSLDASNEYIGEKWSVFYNAVQRANDVIREIPLIKDGSVSASYGAEAVAEAKFLRGVFHFELAKMFRNVPYVDESVTYGAGNFNVPNPGPIWTNIENDFKAAMAGLPATQSQVGRANKWAAQAFLAKTYMQEGTAGYALAKPLLDDLIANGVTAGGAHYALSANYEDNYNAVKKNGPESVFAVQMTVNDGSNGNNDDAGEGLNFAAGTYTSCCGFYQPSYSLANAFKVDANGLPIFGTTTMTVADYTADNVHTANVSATIANYNVTNLPNDHGLGANDAFTPPSDAIDPRLDWTVGRRGIPYLDWGLCGGEQWSRGDVCPYNPIKNTFYHSQQASTADNNGGWATNQGTADNYNMITLADLLLWRAEAEVESGDLAGAMADVNKVRNRMTDPAGWVHTYVDNSDPSKGFTNTPAANYKIGLYVSFPSQAYAREAVHMEEQLEFGMEGHRFFDLQRWDGQFGGPEPAGYMAGIINGHIAADTRIQNPVLDGHSFTQGKNELYPIPLGQIDIEAGKLKQNPKY
jgi:starch-binding outer membrane protein, SusD/RagB family